MKANELTAMSKEQLEEKVKELKSELFSAISHGARRSFGRRMKPEKGGSWNNGRKRTS